MAERNVGKEIALILIATVVLGGAFALYLYKTIPSAEELKADMNMTIASAAAPGASLMDRATATTQRFLDALREKRFADAHALTARAYRESTRPMEFEAAITGSPYMLSPKQISFVRITQQSMKRDDGQVELGPVLARGMLTSDNGNLDVSVTLYDEQGSLHILTIIGAGVPIFNGIVAAQ